jgi:hypothetical protein
MSNPIQITSLPAATTPLTGSEIIALVQAGQTRQVPLNDVWAPVRRRSHGAVWATSLGGAVVAPLAATTEIPSRCQILSLNIIGQGGTGACVIDIWKRQKPVLPTVAQSICSAAKPTITSGTSLFSSNFTGWTSTILEAGDLVTFYLQSSSVFTAINFQLIVEETP